MRYAKKRQSPETVERRNRIKQLAEIITNLSPEEKQAYIDRVGIVNRIGEGGMLSPYNMCLVLYQMGEATLVGGYNQWLNVGRQVRRGERSICIFAPSNRKRTVEKDGEEITVDRVNFRLVPVFDVSQTDPIEGEKIDNLSE